MFAHPQLHPQPPWLPLPAASAAAAAAVRRLRARMQHSCTDLPTRAPCAVRRAPCAAAASAATTTDAGRHARLVPEDGARDNRDEWVAATQRRK